MPGLPAEAGEQIITDTVKCGKMVSSGKQVGMGIAVRA
jgi:hypothetical protein